MWPVHQPDALETTQQENAKWIIPSWVIWLIVALALLRGSVYAIVFPPWQSPDEHGHYEYAWLISQHGPFVGPESISLEFQQRVLESMYEFDYWRLVNRPIPEALPTSFTDPSDEWLRMSRPQVGDERPLYYLLVGGLLRLTDDRNVLTGMYIGRIVSIVLYAASVGVAALATRQLFPESYFMQVVPPAFLLLLPMLGEMSAAINSDSMGVLTSTLFFASLIPIFRDGLSWRHMGTSIATLILALLSKKTTLFLVATALLAVPVYGWTRRVQLPRKTVWLLAAGALLACLATTAMAVMPGDDAVGWLERTGSCGATRVEQSAPEGEAALRIGTCADEVVSQALLPETVRRLVGQQVVLKGWVRSTTGAAVGQASVWDSEGHSNVQIAAGREWQPFTLTHTVNAHAHWVGVRLTGEGAREEAVLFDDLILLSGNEENILINGSAEQTESLLLDLLSNVARKVGAPRLLVARLASPQSWSWDAWQDYRTGITFCLHSFWGIFGWVALPLPPVWYTVINVFCLAATIGNLVFLVGRASREWRTGYLLLLMGGVLLLGLQTFLPMIVNRGTYWLPQGRYLFPGILAIAVLLAWGLWNLLWRRYERWLTIIAVGLVAWYDISCLAALIIPYYGAVE